MSVSVYTYLYQDAVTCDMRYGGLICRNEDLPAGMTCPDYQVRFLCEPRHLDCGNVTPTATPSSITGNRTTIAGHTTRAPEIDYPGQQLDWVRGRGGRGGEEGRGC